jgi:hypothetical protein
MRLCCASNEFADESVLQRISSLMRLCGASNQFPNESVLQGSSSLTRLCGSMHQFPDEVVMSRGSLTSICFSESVPSQVCASANQFAHGVVWCKESVC